mmetsp:Transcript_5128/g.12145  ORF Transcript_5128/g.12145 Transcript_5128/m.12145 type:complete len:203 (+) Transcript_5128:1788-2396(+)
MRTSTWLSTSSMAPWVPLRCVAIYSMAAATAATASLATMSMVIHASFGFVVDVTRAKNASSSMASVPSCWKASTKRCYPVPPLEHRLPEDTEDIPIKALFKPEISSNEMPLHRMVRALLAVWAATTVLPSRPPILNLLLPVGRVRILPRLAYPVGRLLRRLRTPQLHRLVPECLSRTSLPRDTTTRHLLPNRTVPAEAELAP